MKLKHLLIAMPAALLAGSGLAQAGQTIDEAGVIVCVNDKWDEKEVGKGAQAGRCCPAMRPRSERSCGPQGLRGLRG